MNIRSATLNDIEGIARVYLESWKTTYKNIISDKYLSSLTLEEKVKSWTWIFDHSNHGERLLVLEDDDRIVGFISGGKNRDKSFDYGAEIYAFYLLREVQGKGWGRQLFNKFIEEMKLQNYDSSMVWVLKDNPATHFYQKLGGAYVTEAEDRIGEETFIEIALGWKGI